MNTPRKTATLTAALATCLMAGSALAMPAAFDRVPEDALVAVGISNIAELKADMESFIALLPESPEQFDELNEILDLPGVDPNGSMAFAMVAPADGAEPGEDNLVLIAPVADYAQFITGLGGAAEGVSEVDAFGRTMYIKDGGNGYAIASPLAEVTDSFDAAPGKRDAHIANMGDAGQAVASSSDIFVLANVQALKPMIDQAVAEGMEQAKGFAAMAGDQADQVNASINMMKVVTDGFTRDGRAGMLGLDFGSNGLVVDLAANFNEGSEIAGFFNAPGNAASLFGKLPATEFFFAGAYDLSAEGTKTLFGNMMEMSKQMTPDAGDWSWMTQADGASYVMGATQNLMGGGLFSNTYAYFAADDAAGFKTAMKNAMGEMDGTTNQGVTTTTTYTDGVAELGGVSVDGWSMKMAPDGSNPAAAQMQQMMMMIYGPAGGPSGLVGATDGGVVMTMTDNQGVMTLALQAAGGEGANLGGNASMQSIADRMPENASSVGYIGVGSLLQTAAQFMMMMGGGMQMDVPADLPPVGMATVTDGGAFHARFVTDAATIKGVSDIVKAMQPEAADVEGGDEPRF